MEYEEAAILLQKIFGPILLVLCPIVLAIIFYGGIKSVGTTEELSVINWILGISFGFGGFFLGVFICRNQLGWFGGKNPN